MGYAHINNTGILKYWHTDMLWGLKTKEGKLATGTKRDRGKIDRGWKVIIGINPRALTKEKNAIN